MRKLLTVLVVLAPALAGAVLLLPRLGSPPQACEDRPIAALFTAGSMDVTPVAIAPDLAQRLGLTEDVSLSASHVVLRRRHAGAIREVIRLADDKGYVFAYADARASHDYWADRHLNLVSAVSRPVGGAWRAVATPESTLGLKRERVFWTMAAGELRSVATPRETRRPG